RIYVWIQLHNVRAGTTTHFELYRPDGELHRTFTTTHASFFSMSWWWFWHDIPGYLTEPGTWRVVFRNDETLLGELDFELVAGAPSAPGEPAAARPSPPGPPWGTAGGGLGGRGHRPRHCPSGHPPSLRNPRRRRCRVCDGAAPNLGAPAGTAACSRRPALPRPRAALHSLRALRCRGAPEPSTRRPPPMLL